MKIYVVTTGENAITVSLNGEAAVAKTVKPTLTALGNGRIRFLCDDIDEEVETYRHIFINAVPLKGSWIAEEDYLSVALFEAIMNKTFISSGSPGGGSLLSATVELTDAQIKALPTTPIQIVAAPGDGKVIGFLSAYISSNNAGGIYGAIDANASLYLDTDGTGNSAYSGSIDESSGQISELLASFTNKLAVLSKIFYQTALANESAFDNKPIVVWVDNGGAGNFTGGNAANTLKVTVYYVVVDL